MIKDKYQNVDDIINHYINIIQMKNLRIEDLKDKVKKLENALKNNKIFLNMVVHDMRNPIKQIEFLLEQSIELLNDLELQQERV